MCGDGLTELQALVRPDGKIICIQCSNKLRVRKWVIPSPIPSYRSHTRYKPRVIDPHVCVWCDQPILEKAPLEKKDSGNFHPGCWTVFHQR